MQATRGARGGADDGRLARTFADPTVKALSVLGSTGSIGTQTLELAEEFPDRYRVVALTAGNNLDLLVEQIRRHAPEAVALADPDRLNELRDRLNALEASDRPARLPELLGGSDGLCTAAAWPRYRASLSCARCRASPIAKPPSACWRSVVSGRAIACSRPRARSTSCVRIWPRWASAATQRAASGTVK